MRVNIFFVLAIQFVNSACFGMLESRKHYSMSDVETIAKQLVEYVNEGDSSSVKKEYNKLQDVVNSMNSSMVNEYSECHASVNESGNEFACDPYTEFIMLLNIALAPLQKGDMPKRIESCLE